MRFISSIIVHCSATDSRFDIGVREIRRYHVGELGWKDVGYHFIIRLDGTVEEGRNVEMPGAHCQGHNSHSIGVCYIGGLNRYGEPTDTRTLAQRDSLLRLLSKLKREYPEAVIVGHNFFTNKSCPCFNAQDEFKHL